MPKLNYCITGIYFYGKCVFEFEKRVKVSSRSELENTTLNDLYLKVSKYLSMKRWHIEMSGSTGMNIYYPLTNYGKSLYGKHLKRVSNGILIY